MSQESNTHQHFTQITKSRYECSCSRSFDLYSCQRCLTGLIFLLQSILWSRVRTPGCPGSAAETDTASASETL